MAPLRPSGRIHRGPAGPIVAAAVFGLACAVRAEPLPTAPSHHRDGGYQNNYVEFEPKGLGDLLRWRIDAMRNHLPPPPAAPTPQVQPDIALLAANTRAGAAMRPTVTWIGHASVLAQLGGLNLLTDPMFSERASPLAFIGPKRQQPSGLALAELPHIDAVLISHNHYDHLDAASVKALASQAGGPPRFIVPLGLKRWFAARDIEAVELDWWQSETLAAPGGPVEIVFTPSQHWSGRGLGDRMKTLWGGYAVLAPDFHLFFAGDTAYSQDFADIRARFAARQTSAAGGGFDLALIPIGAYEPRWFMASQHVDPPESVRIHLDLGAKRSIGVHWGTFALTDEALDAPPVALAEARRAAGVANDAFFTLAIGETRVLPRRPPTATSGSSVGASGGPRSAVSAVRN